MIKKNYIEGFYCPKKKQNKTFLAAELLAVPVQDELVVVYDKNGKELGVLQREKKVKCCLKNKLNATVQIK